MVYLNFRERDRYKERQRDRERETSEQVIEKARNKLSY